MCVNGVCRKLVAPEELGTAAGTKPELLEEWSCLLHVFVGYLSDPSEGILG